ncbi:hypothetical protein J3458_001829 [Metarhizium acridum]|uniref:uncharacterized protein n=1 Tax=Metarhizium acridum TaxID=92637 RepID=UPI001C6CCB12|nr:hypothetical protein J3458_001829 [Metarhizium acridum]
MSGNTDKAFPSHVEGPYSSRTGFRIDIHTHIMPRSLPDTSQFDDTSNRNEWINFRPHKPPPSSSESSSPFQKLDMYVGRRFFQTVEANCFDPETRIKEMDASGVSVQVLGTILVLFSYDKPIKPTDVAAAVEELKREKGLGLRGVEIGTETNGRELDDLDMGPFWKACEELDTAVYCIR